MWKVLIADDEEHICKLITALVDWNAMNMEVVGTASNGIEALELVKNKKPDILITDIRMPGLGGLELIEKVKEENSNLEVVIISGYAQFSYAQTAMQYGVGDYLLKPINKNELIQTLQKIGDKIAERTASEQGLERLIRSSQNDRKIIKSNLAAALLEHETELSLERLRDTFHFEGKEGIFQAFCLKMDYEDTRLNGNAKQLLLEKANDIILGNLKPKCYDVVFSIKEYYGYGIMNFPPKALEDMRRILKDCLNQLQVQKEILGPVEFTIALGMPVREPSELSKSLEKSVALIQERIVAGTGVLIENAPENKGMQGKKLLEQYSRSILHAIEVMSIEEAACAAMALQEEVVDNHNIRGSEILELVISAGSMFLMQIENQERSAKITKFTTKCNQCSSVQQLFLELQHLQTKLLEALQEAHDNEALRPIRLARQYIQNHYKEQISLEEVSSEVGLSASYFSVLFKKELGEGFAKYLIHVRMEEAKQLLRESNTSIAEICRLVGYNDLKHFNHTFQKTTGLKPGAYRKLYG